MAATYVQGKDVVEKLFSVYILANKRNGTLYVGVTSNLVSRVWQHKHKLVDGFTAKYGVDKLMYYEMFEAADLAITREKQLKKWRRAWKIELIEDKNPAWDDLFMDIVQ